MEITKEEEEIIALRRARQQREESVAPPGIGTSSLWAKAKFKKKKFIDTGIFIEEEGK